SALFILGFLFIANHTAYAQNEAIIGLEEATQEPFFDSAKILPTLSFRNLGPYRGGRSIAAAGIEGDILTYYAGFTGGGVYKTEDAGQSWTNISDDYFKIGSIGAIAVSDSDSDVIYVGTGESCIRGNISPG